jgi:ABC-type Na+ transport system ATPase subunit NatA
MLEINGLRKTFGELVAVGDVSFDVERGQLVGLLGPNGAGKTTTVSMIAGVVTPDRGEVRVAGKTIVGDTDPGKRKIGLVPQDLALYEELSARDNLRFFGELYNLSGSALTQAIGAALELVGLADRERDRVKTFSGGMKRRLNLAAGLLHDPDILLLDEPTVGVDPQSRNAIFNNLEELKRRGKALLYTTHYIQFLMFASAMLGVEILLERQRGLWKRLRSAPVSRRTLLAAKTTSSAIISLVTLLVSFGFAMVVFKVRIEGSVAGFLAVGAACSLMAATFGLLVAALGKTPATARGMTSFVVLLMVMLGGAWVPTFVFPAWLQALTVIVPVRWAVDGLDAMTWRGIGLSGALAPTAALLGFAVLFGAIAFTRFRWEEV